MIPHPPWWTIPTDAPPGSSIRIIRQADGCTHCASYFRYIFAILLMHHIEALLDPFRKGNNSKPLSWGTTRVLTIVSFLVCLATQNTVKTPPNVRRSIRCTNPTSCLPPLPSSSTTSNPSSSTRYVRHIAQRCVIDDVVSRRLGRTAMVIFPTSPSTSDQARLQQVQPTSASTLSVRGLP